MTGRRRRASTSSVESVDESQIRWCKETSVVRSVSKDELINDWPQFELRDAVVLNRDGKTLENALHVGIRGPFIVRGTLLIDEREQKSRLITRVHRRSFPIEIHQCTQFSIGESGDDGSPIIWISGRGGWYEIKPAPEYRAMYRKMCEATTLYYSLVDYYDSKPVPKKAKKQKQSEIMDELSRIFLEYAARVGDGCTFDEVVARCHEHAGFFILQFAQQETQFNWAATAFHKWLTAEHAVCPARPPPDPMRAAPNLPAQELCETIQDLIRNPRKLSPLSAVEVLSPKPREATSTPLPEGKNQHTHDSRDSSTRQSSRAASSRAVTSLAARPHQPSSGSKAEQVLLPVHRPETGDQLHSFPSPPPQQPATPGDASAMDNDDSPLASVLGAMDMAYRELANKKRGLTTTSFLNKIYFVYTFPTYKDGPTGSFKLPVREVLHYNASALLERLDKSKYEGSEIYALIQQLSKEKFAPLAYKASDFPVTLTTRKRMPGMTRKKANTNTSAIATPDRSTGDVTVPKSEREVSDGAASDDGRGGPGSGRGKGLKREGSRSGQKSVLRPVSSKRKRVHSLLESESDGEAPVETQPHEDISHDFSNGDEDETMEDAPDAETSRDEGDLRNVGSGGGGGAVGLPETPSGPPPIKIVIRAEKMASTTPKGPDDTWTCDQDGCDYMVRGGDGEECQARIREHFSLHAQQLERVSLAVTESRGHLPINHLLDKIKRMGEKKKLSMSSMSSATTTTTTAPASVASMTNGSAEGGYVTQPIKRRLIV